MLLPLRSQVTSSLGLVQARPWVIFWPSGCNVDRVEFDNGHHWPMRRSGGVLVSRFRVCPQLCPQLGRPRLLLACLARVQVARDGPSYAFMCAQTALIEIRGRRLISVRSEVQIFPGPLVKRGGTVTYGASPLFLLPWSQKGNTRHARRFGLGASDRVSVG